MTEKTINITSLVKDANDGLTADERAGMKWHLAEKLQALAALTDTLQTGRVGTLLCPRG